MKSIQQSNCFSGTTIGSRERRAVEKRKLSSFLPRCLFDSHSLLKIDEKRASRNDTVKYSWLAFDQAKLFCSAKPARRRRGIHVINSQSCSDSDMFSHNAEERFTQSNGHPERFTQSNGHPSASVKEGIFNWVQVPSRVLHPGSVGRDLTVLAVPAILGQAIDPLAQLMETAYIGRLGPVELASAGVSVSIFNIISKLFNVPLLSITTSFVAEDISRNASKKFLSDVGSQEVGLEDKQISNKVAEKLKLPSVSTALLLAAIIGSVEGLALFFGAGIFLNMMGISPASPMRSPSLQFLSLRALGAPAVVVSLAIQGVFRGFKDTKTPLFCVGLGNLSSVILLPLLAYSFQLGVMGAAIATVASQYITTFLLIMSLNKSAVIFPPKIEDLQFDGYIKSGGLLLGRTLSVLVTMTLGTSMAARQGPLAMAAHQICLQVWLAVSLLSDALALSAQALIASSFAKFEYKRVKEITYTVLKTGLFTGVALAIVLFASFGNIAELFTKDVEVLQIVKTGVLFVSASQPINALAFIFDGLHYGVSDFSYAACAMMVVGIVSSVFLLYAPSILGLAGVWCGLTLFMGLRMAAGFLRLYMKTGPWWFLQRDIQLAESPESLDSRLRADTHQMELDYAITTD